MSGEAGTLERLTRFAAEALSPLRERLTPEQAPLLLEQLGLHAPPAVLDATALSSAANSAQQLFDSVPALVQAIDDADSDPASILALVQAGAATLQKIISLINSLKALAASLEAGAAAQPPDVKALLQAFAQELPGRLTEYLLIERLLVVPQAPVLDPSVVEFLVRLRERGLSVATVLGLADTTFDDGSLVDRLVAPHQRRRLYLNAVGRLASDPLNYFADLYGWGQPAFNGELLFARLAHLLDFYEDQLLFEDLLGEPPVLGIPSLHATVGSDPLIPGGPKGVLITMHRPAVRDYNETFPLGATWSFFVDVKARFEAGLNAGIFPNGRITITPPLGEAHAEASVGLRAQRIDQKPMTLVGVAGIARLELNRFEARAGVKLASALPPGKSEATPIFELRPEGLTCVLDVGQGDSFLKTLSGGGRGRSDITMGATWSPIDGLKLSGSAGLEIAIPAHVRLGPATLETVYLIGTVGTGGIGLEVSGAIRGELGPFKAVADRIGVTLTASFPDGGGNLGPMQLDGNFKPPSGLGLSISGGGFSGGGFLDRDPANGEYAGALELSFQEVIQVKAFGVLNTRMPDGAEAFSLAVVISAEFTPIQLSFGFTLMGVGGLIGVNRTALYDQLRLGIRDGSLESILFPRDLVANAPRIINDLKRMFPPQEGRFLIGPMAKLGWGTPALVTLDIGLILEIPRPGFAILGVLRLAIPAKDVAILDLQVNFLGVVDFERKEISFDASLFDSRLLAFTLTGDMAVRIYWGDNANFLLTVGGFHPDYRPPPLNLPVLNRLGISMWAGNPRLSAEAYFAITSNSVQFGAKVELYYGVKVFNVYGFISLDALIQCDPFHFVATIAGQIAVRSGGSTLFSIRLDLLLEGPTPWHAKGRGSFEIGFIITVTVSADFEVTFGQARNTSLPPVKPRSMIEEALGVDAAWRVLAPGRPHVATRELPEGSGLVVPPMGALIVSQKAAPLNLPLARVGARRVEGANRFSIVDVRLGTDPEPPATLPVEEEFAPAQFLDLSDSEKLSRRSFEPFEAGVEIAGGSAPMADAQKHVDVVYEVIYVRKPRRSVLFRLRDTILDLLVAGSAAGRSKLSAERTAPTGLGTPAVVLPREEFVLAGVDDLAPHGTKRFSSQSAAMAALKVAVANDAQLTNRLQVVSSFEAAA